MKHRLRTIALCSLFIILIGGCSSQAPIQEMSDARQALQAAKAVQGEHYSPYHFNQAEFLLSQAERELARGAHNIARSSALSAKQAALRAYSLGHSLDEAERLIQQAKAVQQPVSDAQQLLEQARNAAEKKDAKRAIELAQAARQLAESSLNEWQLEKARYLLSEFKARFSSALPAQQRQLLQDAEEAARYQQGARALELSRRLHGLEEVPVLPPRDAE